MTQYNRINLGFNQQPKNIKPSIKHATQITLKLSSSVIGDSNNEAYFPYKLLQVDRHVSKLLKALTNNVAANIKLSKLICLK